MLLSVAPELKQPGKIGKYHALLEYGPVEYLGRSVRFAAPLEISLEYSFDGSGFDLSGSLKTVLSSRCTRCDGEFEQPFIQEVSERFVRDSGEDDGCYAYTGDELDLSQMLLENILLNLPAYSVCKPDCKGLCPICGQDLNHTQCSCAEAKLESPFSALAGLLTDDKEV